MNPFFFGLRADFFILHREGFILPYTGNVYRCDSTFNNYFLAETSLQIMFIDCICSGGSILTEYHESFVRQSINMNPYTIPWRSDDTGATV